MRRTEMKYQIGIQKSIFEIIQQSKKNRLPYITKQQILDELKDIITLKSPSDQVSQALYQLQRETKFRRPRIRKYTNNKGIQVGWTVIDDMWLFKE